MEQVLCLNTLQHIEEKLQVLQAMVMANCPAEDMLLELMAARNALSLVEAQIKVGASGN